MTLIRSIEKSYVYTFYVFIKFLPEEWAAITLLTVFQVALTANLISGIAWAAGHPLLHVSKLEEIVLILCVYLFAHFTLIRRHRWRRYKPEFEKYSKAKQRIGSIAVWGGLALTIVVSIVVVS
jgi:hypothetical protein